MLARAVLTRGTSTQVRHLAMGPLGSASGCCRIPLWQKSLLPATMEFWTPNKSLMGESQGGDSGARTQGRGRRSCPSCSSSALGSDLDTRNLKSDTRRFLASYCIFHAQIQNCNPASLPAPCHPDSASRVRVRLRKTCKSLCTKSSTLLWEQRQSRHWAQRAGPLI